MAIHSATPRNVPLAERNPAWFHLHCEHGTLCEEHGRRIGGGDGRLADYRPLSEIDYVWGCYKRHPREGEASD